MAALTVLRAKVQQLEADLVALKADRERLLQIQREIGGLLGTKSPDRIVHDLRNVLNERELYRSLVDLDE